MLFRRLGLVSGSQMLDVEDPLSLGCWVKTVISKNLPHSPHELCFGLYLLSCLFISSLFISDKECWVAVIGAEESGENSH